MASERLEVYTDVFAQTILLDNKMMTSNIKCGRIVMEFNSISIKNFRNFEDISIDLRNKNVFFGMNDIGKTNLLCAIRYLFDRDMRRTDLVDTDYFKRTTKKPIEITATIDITENNIDTEKLRARLKGCIGSSDTTVFIRMTAEYNEQENRGDITLKWGCDENKLVEMKSTSGGFIELDALFQVYYINSYIDLHNLFKKNISTLVKKDDDQVAEDRKTELKIEKKVGEINTEISKLSGVKNFEGKLTPSYKKMRDENISISIKSDFAMSYLYSNIVPYIHKDGETGEYPTQGEGRKKLVAYSVYNILAENTVDKKINLFLIEEPETHLHKTMQSALSYFLFDDAANKKMLSYLFVSTHSPFILSDMDDVNLVRIYNSDKITSGSEFYSVPCEWSKVKKKLNRSLSEAIFADSVLLVEGESECILFERILSQKDPYYESKGVCVISVEGIGFSPYVKILTDLGIKCVVKTDNDVTKVKNKKLYQTLGFARVNKLIKQLDNKAKTLLPTSTSLSPDEATDEERRKRYDDNKLALDGFREKFNVYLSRCGLEEDLYECLGDRLVELIGENPVNRLQKSKQHNMVDLVSKLELDDCKKIYNHYNFACLKAVQV